MTRREFANSLINHRCGDPMEYLDMFEFFILHGYQATTNRYWLTAPSIKGRINRLESMVGEKLYHFGLTVAGEKLFRRLQETK